MSGISSGIGLVSGIDTAKLIDQLIALESRPVQSLQNRVRGIDVQRTAFLELSAQLLAVRNAVANFNKLSFFNRFNAPSTNESVLKASASESATPGSATFRVHSLVTNHAVVSRGFADADRTSVGAGTLTIESAAGRVNPSTELAALNGGRGVRRGQIIVTDRSGASATIDLARAITVDDVLDAINSNADIHVRASVTGVAFNGTTSDRIVINDLSGGTGNLVVADPIGGSTAADLGLAADAAAGRIDGANLVRLDATTPLSFLNDGNGVDRFPQGAEGDDLHFSTTYGDFGVSLTDVLRLSTDLRALNDGHGVRLGVIRITDRAGQSVEVDLTAAKTALDVRDAINNAGLAVSATTVNSRFLVTDTLGLTGEAAKNLKIEDVSGFAAADLGIAADVSADSINGRDVYRVATVGDLVRAINYAPGNASLVEAAISANGKGIALRALGFDNTVSVSVGQDTGGNISQTASDLGLVDAVFSTNEPFDTRPLIGGLNTVLLRTLNGGQGVGVGVVSFTDRLNRTASIDLGSARTLADVVDLINADTTISLTASVNSAGNGLVIRDDSGGNSPLRIADVSGTLAADLKIAATVEPGAGDSVQSGSLQRQYISRQTRLSDLNAGQGVTLGAFRVTDTLGGVHPVTIESHFKDVGDVIDAINRGNAGVFQARINDTGDGILITDAAGGSLPLIVEAEGTDRTAADLGLLGSSRPGENFIDGSLETEIDIDAGDTLKDIAAKVNAAGAGFTAAVLNDGGSVNPFSLSIASAAAGRRGELLFDTADLDLGLTTFTRAQDAVVSIGASAGSTPRLVTSSSNRLEGAIDGVTIDLLATSDEPVTVTVAQDIDGIVESIQTFVEKYNDVQTTIDKDTSFNPDTFQRGPLLSDPTIDLIRSRLHRLMSQPFEGVEERVSQLFSVGLRLGEGSRLEFDAVKFRKVYEESPESVEQLFTLAESGFGAELQKGLDELTQDFDGVLSRKDELLADQQEVLNDRISSLNVLLAAKRARLEAQFAGLETSLAALQDQQNALGQLALLIGR